MADRRKVTIHRPSAAGRMDAQSPQATQRKPALLSGDLEQVKLEPHYRVSLRVLTSNDVTPYAIQDTDDVIIVTNNAALFQLVLPKTVGRTGQRVSIGKNGGLFNVEVLAASGDRVGAVGFTGARILAADNANMMLVANERQLTWWIEAVRGTVTEF